MKSCVLKKTDAKAIGNKPIRVKLNNGEKPVGWKWSDCNGTREATLLVLTIHQQATPQYDSDKCFPRWRNQQYCTTVD